MYVLHHGDLMKMETVTNVMLFVHLAGNVSKDPAEEKHREQRLKSLGHCLESFWHSNTSSIKPSLNQWRHNKTKMTSYLLFYLNSINTFMKFNDKIRLRIVAVDKVENSSRFDILLSSIFLHFRYE